VSVVEVGCFGMASSKDCATQESETLKRFPLVLGSREVAFGAGGVLGMGVVDGTWMVTDGCLTPFWTGALAGEAVVSWAGPPTSARGHVVGGSELGVFPPRLFCVTPTTVPLACRFGWGRDCWALRDGGRLAHENK